MQFIARVIEGFLITYFIFVSFALQVDNFVSIFYSEDFEKVVKMDQLWGAAQSVLIITILLYFFIKSGKEFSSYKKGMLLLYILSFALTALFSFLFLIGNLIIQRVDFVDGVWMFDTLYFVAVLFLLFVSIRRYREFQKA
ncbi:hypothetical protein AB685_00275 [Bacillus sp. LL01]|uniref:hypothetical protein n=1 Tax=Bacillus sp. LL01 TaxID=1665556 RepID=UPI00064D3DAD|nr:hypothetical protein [Bacillus sp. LL01]KMJ59364.1 hypothetical protein AB685_00275 [Bacillus sp. LL01]